jgi:menaquinone-specific isochorismate synthase
VVFAGGLRAPGADPLRFLAAGDAPRAFFAEPGGETVAAVGAVVVLEAEGPVRLDAIRLQAERWRERMVVAGGGPDPRFVGGFAFADAPSPEEAWEGFPPARFILPSVAIVQRDREAWVSIHRLVEGREDPEALARHVHAAAERASQPYPEPAAPPGLPLPAFGARVLDRTVWTAAVGAALRALRAGPLAKVVLARRVPVPLTAPLPGPAALARISPHYADAFRYLVEPRAGRHFLGATPELLVRMRGLRVESAAVAGSAARGRDALEDEALGRALQTSPKERREHAFVVDHVRERLARAGVALEAAPPEPAVLRLRNVQHLLTPFAGQLAEPTHVLDLAAALHPTPAVAGAPPEEALRFIAQHEAMPRGWYAGGVGWFDLAGDGCIAVALRCALVEDTEAWLYAGAGIVEGADPEREFDETVLKLQPMLEALGCRP